MNINYLCAHLGNQGNYGCFANVLENMAEKVTAYLIELIQNWKRNI